MGSVVSFPKDEEPDGPHLSGDAICGACSHEWQAVVPVGVDDHLECPNCHRVWGTLKHPVIPPKSHWRCNCGEVLFWLKPAGAMCRRCGIVSSDWED